MLGHVRVKQSAHLFECRPTASIGRRVSEVACENQVIRGIPRSDALRQCCRSGACRRLPARLNPSAMFAGTRHGRVRRKLRRQHRTYFLAREDRDADQYDRQHANAAPFCQTIEVLERSSRAM